MFYISILVNIIILVLCQLNANDYPIYLNKTSAYLIRSKILLKINDLLIYYTLKYSKVNYIN